MPPLDQFKNMPKEPQLWERDKVEQDNRDYSAPLKVPLADQKSQLMTELYWVKPKINSEDNANWNTKQVKKQEQGVSNQEIKPEENNQNDIWSKDKSPDKKVDISKLDSDSPYFPTLKNLFSSGHIDEATFTETTKKLDSSKNDEWLEVLMKVVNGLSDPKVKESIVKTFDKKEKTTEENFDKTEFSKDCKWLDIDLDKWVGWLELMLADNYVSVNNSDWTEDKQRDLSSSMDTTMNSILKNGSEDFKKQNWPLIKEIKTEKSLNKKYKLLKDLYKEDLKRDAILWWKRSKEEVNKKKNNLIEQAKDITKQIKEAENIVDEVKRKETIDKLEDEKAKVIEEWKEIDWFEAEVESLAGWEADIVSEWWKKDSTD